ncbi:MAG: hypothetical protein U5Q44_03105 [Dehalococcoidia bacterium]|nr:hypothetical protein [Dehalococcoidia bacterium]
MFIFDQDADDNEQDESAAVPAAQDGSDWSFFRFGGENESPNEESNEAPAAATGRTQLSARTPVR